MPIYEYQCRKCKAHLEVLQKIIDKPLTKCSKCGGRLEKQWSSTSFQLKGSGWYVTDYAGKKSEAGEEKQSAPQTTETAAANDKAAPKEKPTSKKTDAAKTTASTNTTSGD
jgi:putative FmdB family regulatory protein